MTVRLTSLMVYMRLVDDKKKYQKMLAIYFPTKVHDVAKYTAQNKYDYMSLYAFFYYADLST